MDHSCIFHCSISDDTRSDTLMMELDADGHPRVMTFSNGDQLSIIRFNQAMPDPSAFELPEACKKAQVTLPQSAMKASIRIGLRHLIPYIVEGHTGYDAFLKDHPRQGLLPMEYLQRLDIYRRHLDAIRHHNAQSDMTYELKGNRYLDWSQWEYFRYQTGVVFDNDFISDMLWEHVQTLKSEDRIQTPEEFSWKGTPADASVKDQGHCAAAYACTASSVMTGAWWIATNQSVDFSVQSLIDCTWPLGNMGCSGGRPELAFLGILQAVPQPISQSVYPYMASDAPCRSKEFSSVGPFINFFFAGRLSEDLTKSALMQKGPLSVLIDASLWDFKFYKSGVYSNPLCLRHPEASTHSVTLVGYGTEDGRNYWLIKNSWGTDWGEDGYMKIDMGFDCGVTIWPSYIEAPKQSVMALE